MDENGDLLLNDKAFIERLHAKVGENDDPPDAYVLHSLSVQMFIFRNWC